ncbi:hypothetical protein AVEN_241277-1 [Araneus ventricosus]|uniref:Uncharacterized protein n=1 Tax=Araneus ventricosus TaxID=182803 RepID=A0A4Y2NMX0_ARAVE|nr:hypothetical protein AVEN_241277-1 [Araneus ventricosus]
MMQKLNRLRGTIRDRVTMLNKVAGSYEPPATPEESEIILNQKLQNVLELKPQMKKLLADYLDLPDSTNLEDSKKVIYNMEEEIEDLQVKFIILITKYCKAPNADNVPMTVHKPKLKIPDLPLPEFTGKYEEYESFKTQFMSIIGNNESLNDTQKCCYLKASLRDDEKHIDSNQDTFQSLLSELDVDYQNNRAVIDTLIKNVLSVGKANDSPRQLRNLADIIKRNLNALEN